MRCRPILLSTALLGASLAACGCGSSQPHSAVTAHGSSSSAAVTESRTAPEAANPVLGFGHPASAADMRAIAAVVREYYAAAAADDGARLCSLLYSLFAESVADDYGHEPGPPALRGDSCRVVLTKLFRQRHRQQVAELAALRVTGARIQYHKGLALLSFGSAGPPSYIAVKRERTVWKIDVLVDQPLSSR